MFCEKCGSKLPDICVFCTNCGARVDGAPLEKADANPINNQYMQVPAKVKKPFPVWINVILFLFALLSVAALVAVFILGRMAEKDRPDKGDVIATSAKVIVANPKDSQTEILEFELSGTVYEIDIPETEASIAGVEFGNGYVIENSDSEYLDYDYLIENYTAEELYFAYFEIQARYGVSFEDSDITAYFSSKTWYEPIMTEDEFLEDDSIVLNDYEIANVTIIEEAYDYLY